MLGLKIVGVAAGSFYAFGCILCTPVARRAVHNYFERQDQKRMR